MRTNFMLLRPLTKAILSKPHSNHWRNFQTITSWKMKRLFEDATHASAYADFRPVYPETVVQKIIDYSKREGGKFDLAIDVACGNGQSTLQLGKYYKQVVGVDVSRAQIDAIRHTLPNVSFRVNSAEDLSSFANNSTDLVTAAQAIHWFDATAFYSEVKRVLKPGGVLAVYGYGVPCLDSAKANNVFMDFYSITLGKKYWDERRHHVENKYEEFTPLPFRNFERNDDLIMSVKGSIESLKGYITTWSAYRSYLKANPDSVILDDVTNKIANIYSEENLETTTVSIQWPVFMLFGCK